MLCPYSLLILLHTLVYIITLCTLQNKMADLGESGINFLYVQYEMDFLVITNIGIEDTHV